MNFNLKEHPFKVLNISKCTYFPLGSTTTIPPPFFFTWFASEECDFLLLIDLPQNEGILKNTCGFLL